MTTNGHNFHPHGMRWEFAGKSVDTRSLGPGESFVAEATIPPVLLLNEEEQQIQAPRHRPDDAKLYCVKGDFLFHCHELDHLLGGMAGLVRARQSFWLTPAMAEDITRRSGLPLFDGLNSCPDVEQSLWRQTRRALGRDCPEHPRKSLCIQSCFPTPKGSLLGTRADQARIWVIPAGRFVSVAGEPNRRSAETSTTRICGHQLPTRYQKAWRSCTVASHQIKPSLLIDHLDLHSSRHRATSLTQPTWSSATDAHALFGSASGNRVTHGVGWAAPIVPLGMQHHEYYPWTYLLRDGRLFIAGPHTQPTLRLQCARWI
jgi:hypothetical protein